MQKYMKIFGHHRNIFARNLFKINQRNFFHQTNRLLKKDYYSILSFTLKRLWVYQIQHLRTKLKKLTLNLPKNGILTLINQQTLKKDSQRFQSN